MDKLLEKYLADKHGCTDYYVQITKRILRDSEVYVEFEYYNQTELRSITTNETINVWQLLTMLNNEIESNKLNHKL